MAGPVVVVNVHKLCCDALVMVDGLDEVILLDDLSYVKAQQLHDLTQLLSTAGVQDICATRIVTATKGGGFEIILSSLWSSIVKPVEDGLAFTVSNLSFNCLID